MSDIDELEAERLARLHRIGILDTPEDRYFRSIAEQALAILPSTSIAAISLVDAERQWFKAIIGLDVKETPRDVSFCSHTIQGDDVMVVLDATRDVRFANNPLVTAGPRIHFYIGAKLTGGVGALCVMGTKSRETTDDEIKKLKRLAQYVNIQLLSHGALHSLCGRNPAINV